jgi:GT2 family glycosyltransferase
MAQVVESADLVLERLWSSDRGPLGRARGLQSLGLERSALSELRRGVVETPGDGRLWRALFDFYRAEGLAVSAVGVARTIDARGLGELLSAADRAELAFAESPPPISLYVPCYNGAESLSEVLAAVLAQSVIPQQILVVDDCSTDRSAEIASGFSKVECLRHPRNLGLGAARNTALDAVHHPLVASLDSDVVPSEFWLERLLVALLRAPLIGAFGPLIERNAVTLPDRWRARVMPLLYPGQGDIDDAVLYGSNTLFATAALRAVGGFNPRFTGAFDDIDLGNRLRVRGLHIRYVHRAVCEHTRRDSLQRVLRGCYGYRKEAAIKGRMFEAVGPLERRWNTLFRDGIQEIEELFQSGAGALVFPSLLNIFWAIVNDLGEFLAHHDSGPRRAYASRVIAAVWRGIDGIPGLAVSTRETLKLHLGPLIESLTARFGIEGAPAASSSEPRVSVAPDFPRVGGDSVAAGGGSPDLVPGSPLMEDDGELSSAAEADEVYERCFLKCAVVLHFSPAIREQLEEGARESRVSAGTPPSAVRRIAVVDPGYFHSTGEVPARSSAVPRALPPSLAPMQCAFFDGTTALLDLRQREGALKGFGAELVVLAGEGLNPNTVRKLVLVLREWLGARVAVVVTGGVAVDLSAENVAVVVAGTEAFLAELRQG